jgi:hypothetical protein
MNSRFEYPRPVSRREALRRAAAGFGSMAFAGLLAEEASAARAPANPLDPKPPHFPARAKRIIFLFMKGGPSHMDTFDYKPLLQRDDGKPLPFAKPRVQFAETGKLLGSPWKFKKHGESGIMVSSLFPHVAEMVDDLCILNSLHGTNAAHGGRAAEAAHRQRQLHPAEHGLVGHLRPREREPEPPRVHHHLPDPRPRRRE